MSKFNILNIVSVLLLLVILAAGKQLVISISILITLYLGILTIGSIFIQFNFYLVSLNKAQTTKKQVAITFDDGPELENTAGILEILAKHNTKATFFCIGEKIKKQGELLKKMDEAGHLIGNHSYSHSNFLGLSSSKKITSELKLTTELIKECIGEKTRLFRPPFGVTNPSIASALRKSGLQSIGWSLRSFDTVRNSKKVISRLKRKAKAGDVILFHDSRKNTAEILDTFIPWLSENHFDVIGLDELLQIKVYEKV